MNADTNRLELPSFQPSFLSNQATGDSHALWCLEKARPMGNTGRRAVPKAILCLGLCASLYGVSVLAAAQGAAILYDQGPTRPLSDYVEARVPLSAASPSARPPLNQAIPNPAYPVDTPGLTPGPVEPRRVQLPQLASAPFFLIGSDPLSRDWLAHYGRRLATLGAVGFLVKAESDAELQSIRQLAPGIPITPLDGTQLAKTLRLAHYPVLVTAGLIEQ